MTDAELAARQVASSFAGYGTLARAAPTGRALTFAGGRVQAAITPERPERSIVNSVVYAEGGAETTTLEGSAMGEPVYARLGYCSLGRLQMWERRTF